MAFTYYVSTSGSDLATGLTELLAFQHIDKAMNTVAAGDKVWVKADGNYAELAIIDTAGSTTDPIVFEGYTTTPGDGGRATITGSGARANCLTTTLGGAVRAYNVFKNIRFTAATAEGALVSIHHLTFKNCKFDTNGTTGLSVRMVVCENCEFTSNGTIGCETQYYRAIFVGCKFYGNGTNGLESNHFTVVFGCTFFSNAGTNLVTGAGGDDTVVAIINCTFDGDSKDSDVGASVDLSRNLVALINNVFYDCATGLSFINNNYGERVISRNNLVNANTTPYNQAATFTGEVTSAPQFTNEVAGADYTPAAGSPLINAGLNG